MGTVAVVGRGVPLPPGARVGPGCAHGRLGRHGGEREGRGWVGLELPVYISGGEGGVRWVLGGL